MFSCDCVICGSPLQGRNDWSFNTCAIYSCMAGEPWPGHHEIIFNGIYELIMEVVYYKVNGLGIKASIDFNERETYIEVIEFKSCELIQDIVVPCYCRQLDKIKNYIIMA